MQFLFTNKNVKDNIINVGSGEEITIKNLSILISSVVGFKGKIVLTVNILMVHQEK